MKLIKRHKPETFEEIKGQQKSIEIIENMIEYENIPNILLYGPPGTGKTTTAKLFAQNITETYSVVNASKDGRVEDIRETIEPMSMNGSLSMSKKVILFDEFEYMSDDAQHALRNVMDSSSAIFIGTCNNIEKIIDPIQSRFTKLHFDYLNNEEIESIVRSVCDEQNIDLGDYQIGEIVKNSGGDARDAIGELNKWVKVK